MPLPVSAQQQTKLGALTRLLRESGVPTPTITLTPSPSDLGYRNRIRLCIQPGGAVRFFNRQKPPSCAVVEPALRARLEFVLGLSRAEPQLFASFEHLELRSDDARGRPGLVLANDLARPATLLAPASALATRLEDFLVGVRGDPAIACQHRRVVEDLTAFVPLDAFQQINSQVNASLVTALRAGARNRQLHSALDLYSGAGNFAIPLAAAGLEVAAVELHEPAMRALGAAADAQGLACERHDGCARIVCERLLEQKREFQLVIIDAPRAGAREVVPLAAALSSRFIAICSCNPQSLVRDLAVLQRLDFELHELHAFDMFPHTRHLEVLAWLGKRRSLPS